MADVLIDLIRQVNRLQKQVDDLVRPEVPLKVACLAYADAVQTIPNNAATIINLNQENYDIGGMHDNAINNSRLTAPIAGVYCVTAYCAFAANATGLRRISIIHNGATRYSHTFFALVSNNTAYMNISSNIKMASGDYVEIEVFQNSGGDLDTIRPITLSPALSATLVFYTP